MISIKEYAKLHGVSSATIQIKCLKGHFNTARKIGRNWYIDENEPKIDPQRNKEWVASSNAVEKCGKKGIPQGYVTMKEYTKTHNLNYGSFKLDVIHGKVANAKNVGNQWFIEND